MAVLASAEFAVAAVSFSARARSRAARFTSPLVAWVRRRPDVASLGAILGLGLVLRAILLLGAPVFIMKDSASYFLPGWDLSHGRDFDLELRRTPFYSMFVALVLRLFGDSLFPLALAQHCLGLATAIGVYVAGRLSFGRGVGLVAALLTVASGPQLIFEHFVMPESLFTVLVVWGVAGLLYASRSGGCRWYLLSGLILGLAALTRPAAQLVILGLPLMLLATGRGLRAALTSTAAASLGLGLVTVPWMLLVHAEYGVVSTGATVGEPLIFRIVHQDRGFSLPDPELRPYGDPRRDEARRIVLLMAGQRENPSAMVERLRKDLKMTRPEADAALRDAALETIRNQPGYYLASTARLTFELFQGRHEDLSFSWTKRRDRAGEHTQENWQSVPRIRHLVQPATTFQRSQYGVVDLAVNVFQPSLLSGLLGLLFMVGTVASARNPEWRQGLLLSMTAIALVLTCTMFSGAVPRFRYPADPFIALVALGGVSAVLQTLRGRSRRAASGQDDRRSAPAAPPQARLHPF